MKETRQITCGYCKTQNPWEAKSCLACGGPLTHPEVDLETKVTLAPSSEKPKQPQNEDIKKVTEKADELYFMAWNTYAIAWRTVGEAIAIALTGFILGFVGGATDTLFPGIVGATLVGLAIGITRKQFYIVLVSAPAGLLLGLGLGAMIWFLGSEPQVMVYTGMIFAIIGAVIGGKHSLPFRHRNCWEKARPFLGTMGGFVFGALGALIGWGIAAGIQSLIETI
jgi:hypothetical protein